ncbi:hypothetical protein COLO4_29954 [Corchorus olitorius]|uniref:Uncharacterized protein n=1 Tax=Corchorus olitorius TaxID=93759 RepID=A0A1R3HCM3_9ROSI|nr:hypothetical protein COLO4_29954 [Corchorus olitorius]
MVTLLNEYKAIFEKWFEDISPWSKPSHLCERVVWIKLEEVPLHLWHDNFFRALANSWGDFVRVRECTMKRWNVESTWIQLKVKSKSIIPNVVMGNANGDTFRIMVSILEDDHNIFLPSRHGGCNSDYGDSSRSSVEASSSSAQHYDRMYILGST